MPLDPDVVRFLDELSQAGPGLASPLSVATARSSIQPDVSPEALAVSTEDRTASRGDAPTVPVRVYRPTNVDGAVPTVVYYHGGGWVVGSIETHDRLCREMCAASGAVVVSVDYRLAPEHPFPAAFEDAFTATSWAAEEIATLGGNPERLLVAGDSAGGNLAAAVCLQARDQRGPRIALQLLIYPIVDHDFDRPSYVDRADGYFLTRRTMEWFWDHYVPHRDDRDNPLASPIKAESLEGLPPALVVTAEYDPLRDEGFEYAERLRAAGVSVDYTDYDGMIHGFLRRFDQFERSRVLLEELAQAIKSA
ncbi:Carboxylesterase NlhH (NLH-H) [Durusdinium trenchii]|uniref:Carboxylesterase NlhH (NLH-H) n=1 Tax=Durusdinium trenchii TaxID=1381693 RepID=A0ABP0IIU3_9DINO